MKAQVIFVILLFISIPFSVAKEISIPELFDIESSVQDGKEIYFYSGQKLVASSDGTLEYHYQDQIGSDGKSKTLPFGQPLIEENRFLFTGKELDSDLYYFGARYYNPELGRFISVDPMSSEPPYVYVYNNPLGGIDPDGKATATGTTVDPWLHALERLMQEVSKGTTPAEAASGGSAWGAGAGAVLAGIFLTSGPFQAQLQGNHPFHDPFGMLNDINPVYIKTVDPGEDDYTADVNRFFKLNENFVRRPRAYMHRHEHMDGSIEYSALTREDKESGKYATFSISIKRIQTSIDATAEAVGKGYSMMPYEFKINRPDPIIMSDLEPLLDDLRDKLRGQFGLSRKQTVNVIETVRWYVQSHVPHGVPDLLYYPLMNTPDIKNKGFFREKGHQIGVSITNRNIPGEMPNYVM